MFQSVVYISYFKKRNTTLPSNIHVKYRSSRMHFKNTSSEWTKAHASRLFGFRCNGGWRRVWKNGKRLRIERKNSFDIISNFFETRGRYARLARSLTHVRRGVG